MKVFSQSLLSEMNSKLEFIHSQTQNPIQYSKHSIKVIIPILEDLKSFSAKYKFENKEEEIHFFKAIKPHFIKKLIFYNELYNIESSKSTGTRKNIRKYYKKELAKLQHHFTENQEFYKYYRTGNNTLDKKYFLRGKYNLKLTLDSTFFQADKHFSTSHDYKWAQIIANEELKIYLKEEIHKLINKEATVDRYSIKKQKWTGSNVALIELIYALHSMSVINNGNAELKEIVGIFETTFNINLGQFNRTFLEIRERKSEKTKFLNSLKECLIMRMHEADGN